MFKGQEWYSSNAMHIGWIEYISKTQKISCFKGNVRVIVILLFSGTTTFFFYMNTPIYDLNIILMIFLFRRFIMNLKLFTVMGISWILEIITTIYKNDTVGYILDAFNLLIGVFVFFIFVFKRKVFYELKCRFGKRQIFFFSFYLQI